jgi:hypothetical protein
MHPLALPELPKVIEGNCPNPSKDSIRKIQEIK